MVGLMERYLPDAPLSGSSAPAPRRSAQSSRRTPHAHDRRYIPYVNQIEEMRHYEVKSAGPTR